jgi:hypothetical protein
MNECWDGRVDENWDEDRRMKWICGVDESDSAEAARLNRPQKRIREQRKKTLEMMAG